MLQGFGQTEPFADAFHQACKHGKLGFLSEAKNISTTA